LVEGFPVLTKLLGQSNFERVAREFLRNHPPNSPVMMFYGQEFPGFLANFEPTKHLGYLQDVARLELALRSSYHAADAVAINPSELQSVPPDTLHSAKLLLAPAVWVIRSDWPIYDIWRYNTEPGAPKPIATAQDILITRPVFDPAPHLLTNGGAICMEAIQLGESLGDSFVAATRSFPNFDLSALLRILLTGGAIRNVNFADTP
ncbi:MAG: DNA-binding domain-containing protein, partial [Roseibium sp.]